MNTKQTIDVSVIIPVRNRSEYLPGGIASILDQDWSGTLEIICIDDGSDTDPFKALSDPLPPEVRLVRQAHSGLCATRQHGLDLARGRYITFNDDDDLWTPDKLRIQVDALERHSALDMVFSDLREFNDQGDAEETLLAPYRRDIQRQSRQLSPAIAPLYQGDRDGLLRQFIAGMPLFFQSVLMRRAFIDRIGGTNPAMRGYGECLDLAVRAVHGGVIGYVDQPTFKLRRGHSHMTSRTDALDLELAEFFEVYPSYPDSLKQMLKPWLPTLLSTKGWLHFQQGQYRDAAKAYRDAKGYGPLTMRSQLKWMLSTVLGGVARNEPPLTGEQPRPKAASAATGQEAPASRP